MSIYKRMLVIVAAMALPITALAQTTVQSESRSLRGRHEIEISLGFLSQLSVTNEISVAGVETTSEAGGFIGSLGYSYWFAGEWAVDLSVGVANADASMSVSGGGVFMESAAVIPLLFGVSYKPLGLAIGDALRPYAFASTSSRCGHRYSVVRGNCPRLALRSRLGSISQQAVHARV